jgi:Tol biopolymer transport system component
MSAAGLRERDLPGLLAELAPPTKPQYRDAIVRQTAGMRQRPAWAFVERWIPMTTYTTRAVSPTSLPWRMGAVALLLLLAIAAAAFVAGSRRSAPSPFGPAGTGNVAYAVDGDIDVADPKTGAVRLLVGGDAIDDHPVWSHDGSLLAFTQGAVGEAGQVMLVRADGSGLVALMPTSSLHLGTYAFTEDGRAVVMIDGGKIRIADTDGSHIRDLATSQEVGDLAIRPGTGEVLYSDASGQGIFALPIDGSRAARPVVAPRAGERFDWLRVSPDGSRVAYSASGDNAVGNTYQVHVADIDGTTDVTIPMPEGAIFQDAPAWSNDGTRLAITRGYAQRDDDMVLAVVPADGSSTGVETEHRITGCCDTTMEWAPDDTWILVVPQSTTNGQPTQQLRLDPSTGAATEVPWQATSQASIQRVSP